MMRRLAWVLAGLAIAAGTVWTAASLLSPAATDTADAGPPAPVAPPALRLPPMAAPDAGTGAASSPAAGQPPWPAAPARPAAAGTPIGSEGYGPHIEQAQASGDAGAAWEAVQWMRSCASNEMRRTSFEQLRNKGLEPAYMTQLMVEADAEARRCQTVTAQHHALLPELAARAMRGNVPEAASAYANAVFPADLTAAQRREVVDAMRRDAQAGHVPSLLAASLAHESWGLDDTERLAYFYAQGLLAGQTIERIMQLAREYNLPRLKAPPEPQQVEAAKALAQEIVARAPSRP